MGKTAWVERSLPVPAVSSRVFTADLTRPADLTASRRRLRAELDHGDTSAGVVDDDVERLLLAFEELTSNGLRHGGPPVRVTVTTTSSGWLLDVTDAAVDRLPALAVDRDPALGGLGLHMIARLCAQYGWSVSGGRKHVWACVRRTVLA